MISILENSLYTFKAHWGLGSCVCVWERERDYESTRLWEAVNWVGNLNKLEGEIMGWVCLNFVGLFGFRFELSSKCFKFKHNFSKRNFITKQTPTTKKGTAQSSKQLALIQMCLELYCVNLIISNGRNG